jgi:dolichol-phosphate mannosyltransferase
MPSVWVVIPTYNEAENLERVTGAVLAELQRVAGEDHHILIVDDNSPDGTGEIADRLQANTPALEVLHRQNKAGLGQAYVAGFKYALERGAELIFEMDADLSHDPRYLGPMLAETESNDLVLGSRYVPGGGVRDWGWLRRLISRGGGIYARIILGVGVRDLTGGFKCIRREVLEAIDVTSIDAAGYVFQIEVTYRALLAGFRVKEVPIVFRDRTHGSSKMSAKIALEAMLLVPRLRRSAPNAIATAPPRVPPALPR